MDPVVTLTGEIRTLENLATGPAHVAWQRVATGHGEVGFVDGERVSVCAESYATYTEPGGIVPTPYLEATTFGFTIPAGSTIEGIEFRYRRKRSGVDGIGGTQMDLLIGAAPDGTPKIDTVDWPTSTEVAIYGGASDLWGATPTAAEVNAADFGVRITPDAPRATGSVANVNCVKATVWYRPPNNS